MLEFVFGSENKYEGRVTDPKSLEFLAEDNSYLVLQDRTFNRENGETNLSYEQLQSYLDTHLENDIEWDFHTWQDNQMINFRARGDLSEYGWKEPNERIEDVELRIGIPFDGEDYEQYLRDAGLEL